MIAIPDIHTVSHQFTTVIPDFHTASHDFSTVNQFITEGRHRNVNCNGSIKRDCPSKNTGFSTGQGMSKKNRFFARLSIIRFKKTNYSNFEIRPFKNRRMRNELNAALRKKNCLSPPAGGRVFFFSEERFISGCF